MPEPSATISHSADRVLSVTELTRSIKRVLERGFANLWVEGELSNVKLHGSGHLYFSLKDSGAVIPGVMFRSATKIRFEAKDGMKVRVQGRITVYEPRGQYQIAVEAMEPVGIGALELAFRQLYDRLEREGLFDPSRKRALPRHPRVIGIVTSPSGAAIRDLLTVIGRRAPHVEIVVRSTRVQGFGSAEDVAMGIAEFDEWGLADVIIVGRGGGSIEDLWAFNEEIVARAIRACRVPVISAVGHEIDFTIADFAADLRAPTPSAAAEVVTPDRDAVLRELHRVGSRLAMAAVHLLRRRSDRVILLARSAAFRRPRDLYDRLSQQVDAHTERLLGTMGVALERGRLRLAHLGGKLSALSPLAVLQRGYALVFDERDLVVRRAIDVREGERIRVQLAEGSLQAVMQRRLGPEDSSRLDPWIRKDAPTG